MLPYVAATGMVLLAYRWRELRGRTGVLLGAGVLLDPGPLLAHSLAAGRDPLGAVLAASGSGQPAGWADRRHGGLMLGPPLGIGFYSPSHCARPALLGGRPPAAPDGGRPLRLAHAAPPASIHQRSWTVAVRLERQLSKISRSGPGARPVPAVPPGGAAVGGPGLGRTGRLAAGRPPGRTQAYRSDRVRPGHRPRLADLPPPPLTDAFAPVPRTARPGDRTGRQSARQAIGRAGDRPGRRSGKPRSDGGSARRGMPAGQRGADSSPVTAT